MSALCVSGWEGCFIIVVNLISITVVVITIITAPLTTIITIIYTIFMMIFIIINITNTSIIISDPLNSKKEIRIIKLTNKANREEKNKIKIKNFTKEPRHFKHHKAHILTDGITELHKSEKRKIKNKMKKGTETDARQPHAVIKPG